MPAPEPALSPAFRAYFVGREEPLEGALRPPLIAHTFEGKVMSA